MYPHREELSVSFCHRGNYIQAALGMTCYETYKAIAFAYRKERKKRKSCSLFMAVASGPSS